MIEHDLISMTAEELYAFKDRLNVLRDSVRGRGLAEGRWQMKCALCKRLGVWSQRFGMILCNACKRMKE